LETNYPNIFGQLLSLKLPKGKKTRPMGENSPNLVTLIKCSNGSHAVDTGTG
jgi:hypothetical protein